MMFLKQDTFNYDKQSVVLNELSGLQRVEYLTFIRERTAVFDEQSAEMVEGERQIAFLEMGMDINAWLVSRSLWSAGQTQDVQVLYDTVRKTWSYDALGLAAERILALSGLVPAKEEAAGRDDGALTPEKS